MPLMSRLPDLIEFPALKRPARPNNCLVAPEGFTGMVQIDETAPVFDKTPKQVFNAVMDLVFSRLDGECQRLG